MRYDEMDGDIQNAVIFGFMRRMGIREKPAREYMERHPEFEARSLSYMETGGDKWNDIMREVLWGDMSDEDIAIACAS